MSDDHASSSSNDVDEKEEINDDSMLTRTTTNDENNVEEFDYYGWRISPVSNKNNSLLRDDIDNIVPIRSNSNKLTALAAAKRLYYQICKRGTWIIVIYSPQRQRAIAYCIGSEKKKHRDGYGDKEYKSARVWQINKATLEQAKNWQWPADWQNVQVYSRSSTLAGRYKNI